jgi:AraC-like DNA-binding protein
VGKYINDLLMFEAGRLLAADGRTIGEISAALGFCDQFYFSRRFAGHFLMTPREYRKIKANS